MEPKLNAVSICQLLKSSLTRRGGSLPSVYLPRTLRLLTVDRLAVPTLQTFFPGQLTYQRVKQSALIRNTRGPLAAPRCKTLFRCVYFGGRSSRCSLDIKGEKSPRCPEMNCAKMFTYLSKDAGHSRLYIFPQCQ